MQIMRACLAQTGDDNIIDTHMVGQAGTVENAICYISCTQRLIVLIRCGSFIGIALKPNQ